MINKLIQNKTITENSDVYLYIEKKGNNIDF